MSVERRDAGAGRWILLALAMGALAIVLFADLRDQDWAYDDEDYIRSARRAVGDVAYLLNPQKEGLEGQYNAARPTVHLYFRLLRPLLGEDPGGYHLANALVHTGIALLLSILLFTWGGGFPLAALGGLLFLVNISHFRAIYWVAGIGILLGTMIGFLSVLAFMAHLRKGRPAARWVSLLLFTVACFSHESSIVFLGLIAWQAVGRRGTRAGARLLGPYAAILVLTWAASQFAYNTPLSRESDYGLGLHLIRNFPVMLFHLFAGGYYDVRWVPISEPAKIAAGTALLSLLVILACRVRPLALVVLWLFLTIAPHLPFRDGTYAWRYYYVPATAAAVLFAAALLGIGRIFAERLRRPELRIVLPGALAVALALSAYAHMDFLKAVQHSFSGMYLLRHGQYERALTQYERADRKAGDHPFAYHWRFNEALVLLSMERIDEGYELLLPIVARYPSYEKSQDILLGTFVRMHGLSGGDAGGGAGRPSPELLRRLLRREAVTASGSGRWEEAKALATLYLRSFPPEAQIEAIYRDAGEALSRREAN